MQGVNRAMIEEGALEAVLTPTRMSGRCCCLGSRVGRSCRVRLQLRHRIVIVFVLASSHDSFLLVDSGAFWNLTAPDSISCSAVVVHGQTLFVCIETAGRCNALCVGATKTRADAFRGARMMSVLFILVLAASCCRPRTLLKLPGQRWQSTWSRRPGNKGDRQ